MGEAMFTPQGHAPMPLSDASVRSAKPALKPQRLFDAGGLYLEVMPNGSKLWRYKYRFAGKEKRLALGAYPDVGLAAARDKHAEARRLLAAGVDPAAHRRAEKAARVGRAANTFAAIAVEWFSQNEQRMTPGTMRRDRRMVERHLNPWIGDIAIAEVSPAALLACLRRIQATGALETAHRARALAGRLFRYAVATGRAERNPAADLIGALPAATPKHFASVTDPKQVGVLMRSLRGYGGSSVVCAALKLAPLVFARPGELRTARWADIDLDAAEWRYVANKTKTPHIVPLARQAVEILRELRPITEATGLVFPGMRSSRRPISENTINAALRSLGYSRDTMTGHGFRAMARTVLDEQMGFRADFIEHQLAHAVRDPNGRAYNRTAHLAERRNMMQAWADYLDALCLGGNVVPLQRKAS